jgi:hypothetical protein
MTRGIKERGILFTPENYGKSERGEKTQTRRIITGKALKMIEDFSGDPVDPSPLKFEYVTNCDRIDDDGKHTYQYTGLLMSLEEYPEEGFVELPCPFGTVGDRFYVKESFTYWEDNYEWKPSKGKRWDDLTPKEQAEIIQRSDHMGHDYLVYKRDGVKRSLAEWPSPHPIYEHCIEKFDKTVSPIFMPKWAARLWLEITDVRVERLQDCSSEDAVAEGAADWPGECILREKRLTSVQIQYAMLWESIHGPGSWERNPWVWVLSYKKVKP